MIGLLTLQGCQKEKPNILTEELENIARLKGDEFYLNNNSGENAISNEKELLQFINFLKSDSSDLAHIANINSLHKNNKPLKNGMPNEIDINIVAWAGGPSFSSLVIQYYYLQNSWNVNSHYAGFTFSTSWHETNSYGIEISGYLHLFVNGYFSYNIFWEGIGSVYHNHKNYHIIIDMATGNASLGVPPPGSSGP